MGDTNATTTNPFVTDTSGAQAGLYKGIGVALAVASGIFIGSSFVFKKKGLLQSIDQSGGTAGEGYSYLKSALWWTGMILMIVGELCNFIAYAFTQAILVTPLGALSVVISAVLSSIFLKEKLSFQGKIGCLQCILGAIMIVLHAPEQSTADTTINAFKSLVLSPGFLVYAGLATVISIVLVFYCGPKWGKKNMLVYISVCSLIGSISVVFTQGLGAAIVHSISRRENQFTNWFTYIVLGIVVITLVVEIVYLNKALNLFNTALVTPTYYVIFTTMTIVSSIVLYRGFDASPVDVATCVLGFLSICSGVALLHNSKSQPDHGGEALLLNKNNNEGEVDCETTNKKNKNRGLFWIFENKSHTDYDDEENNEKKKTYEESVLTGHHHGGNDPGAADLFPAPFSGIRRYASTTKKTQTMSSRIRLQSSTELNPVSTLKSKINSNSSNSGVNDKFCSTLPSSIESMTSNEDLSRLDDNRKDSHEEPQKKPSESILSEIANQEQTMDTFTSFKLRESESISRSQEDSNKPVPLNNIYKSASGGDSDNGQKFINYNNNQHTSSNDTNK